MVGALKEKFEVESYDEQVQCGDLVITEISESYDSTRPTPSTEGYIKEVMLSFPKGLIDSPRDNSQRLDNHCPTISNYSAPYGMRKPTGRVNNS